VITVFPEKRKYYSVFGIVRRGLLFTAVKRPGRETDISV